MAAPRTLYEKIVDAHTVKRIDANTVLLYPESYILVTRFPEAGVTSAAGPA